jgi:hypothetical protein
VKDFSCGECVVSPGGEKLPQLEYDDLPQWGKTPPVGDVRISPTRESSPSGEYDDLSRWGEIPPVGSM